jgi:chaperonin GroEL
MSQHIFYDADARERIIKGAEKLYEAVKVTMGPKGRNVVIKDPNGLPTITHDGVTVAQRINVTETDETLGQSVGADLIRQAANRNNDNVGDGTTTTTVLAYHILNEANKLIAAGHNPMDLRKEVDAASVKLLAELPKITEKINDEPDKITQVASISSGSPEMGELVSTVVQAVGADGAITVEPSANLGLSHEVVEGYQWGYGYQSQYMVTDQGRMKSIVDKPLILVTSNKIDSFKQLQPVAEAVLASGRKELVIIGDEVMNEALASMILNIMKGAFSTLFVKAPGFGDTRKAQLQDIAILTGATLIGEDFGLDFSKVTIDDLGTARRVEATKDRTVIVEGGGDPEKIASRILELRNGAKAATNEADQFNLPNRASALEGRVAIIKVGGATEAEVEEKKAAVAEGIVAGGGVALLDLTSLALREDTTLGAQILGKALQQPFRQLMTNAGINPDEKLPEVLKAQTGYGFNVLEPTTLVDMLSEGIIDPAKVTREAITNAVSVAGTAMTMGCLVVDTDEANKNGN